MSILNIPQQFLSDGQHDACIIDYSHNKKVSRQKVSFEYYTISLLIEGSKEIYTSARSEKIIASHALVVKRGNCLMTETLSNNTNYKSKLILFSKHFLQQFIYKYDINLKNEEVDHSKFYSVLPFDNYIDSYIQSMSSSELSKRMQKVKIEELLIYIYEKYGSQWFTFLKSDTHNYSLRQVIESHITENLTVEELAFLCNMSVSTFKRAFYLEYQDTPSKWIKKKRLLLSKNELENTNVRASEIYLKYGFGSLSRYISAFKGEYGITPKQFQQSLHS